jgi:O-antigen ligase
MGDLDPGELLQIVVLGLAGSAAVVLGLGASLHAERRLHAWALPAVIPIMALGISLGTLLSGRDLQFANQDFGVKAGVENAAGNLVQRLLTAALLAICVARVVNQLARRQWLHPDGSTSLYIALLFYFLTNNVLNGVFGTVPGFDHRQAYPIALFLLAYAARDEPVERLIGWAKIAVLGMLGLSLAAALLAPKLAIQPNYRGWLPFLHFRLWGVGSHPNSIGPLALTYLLLDYLQPYRNLALRAGGIGVALLVCLLAQSKTDWAILLLFAPILLWRRRDGSARRLDLPGVLLGVLALALLVLVALLFLSSDAATRLAHTQAASDISTLTGRSRIWQVAIEEWLRNPVFGYGPHLWSTGFREQVGMPFAFHAHNQVLQCLSAAGVVGCLTMLVYVFFLGRGALRAAAATRNVSLALFVMLLIQCVTEIPLALSVFSGDALTHLILFCLALRGARAPAPARDEMRERALAGAT